MAAVVLHTFKQLEDLADCTYLRLDTGTPVVFYVKVHVYLCSHSLVEIHVCFLDHVWLFIASCCHGNIKSLNAME